MSRETMPYTLEEVDTFVGHDEGTSRERIRATVNDNARLRALIKAAEWGDGRCPWCGEKRPEHEASCAAFMPDGTVK